MRNQVAWKCHSERRKTSHCYITGCNGDVRKIYFGIFVGQFFFGKLLRPLLGCEEKK